MKSGRRMEKTKTPNDLAALFREWQELRIKVSEAELAAAQDRYRQNKRNRRKLLKQAARARTH
jgi:hypothetical protein